MSYAGARALREHEQEAMPAPRRLHVVTADAAPVYADNGRRTVKITGQATAPRRRRSPAASQIEARPDRVALWAFLLGLLLVVMTLAAPS